MAKNPAPPVSRGILPDESIITIVIKKIKGDKEK
jgi:hypothetical protein